MFPSIISSDDVSNSFAEKTLAGLVDILTISVFTFSPATGALITTSTDLSGFPAINSNLINACPADPDIFADGALPKQL